MQGNINNQMGNQQPGQLQGQLQMNPGMQNPMGGPMGPQLMGFSRNPTPTQFLQQSPSPSVQSPAGMSGPPNSNQMVPSPALAPSPGSNLNIMGNTGPPRSIGKFQKCISGKLFRNLLNDCKGTSSSFSP